MSDLEITPTKSFECPICFRCWTEVMTESVVGWSLEPKECAQCANEDRSSLAILKRQIESLPSAHVRRFPEVLKRLILHIDLKE